MILCNLCWQPVDLWRKSQFCGFKIIAGYYFLIKKYEHARRFFRQGHDHRQQFRAGLDRCQNVWNKILSKTDTKQSYSCNLKFLIILSPKNKFLAMFRIAYGHAFAMHDESDQALAAYRTASRLFMGTNSFWTCFKQDSYKNLFKF